MARADEPRAELPRTERSRAELPRADPPRAAPRLAVVILAAGRGTRMHSDVPKVLQPLAGRPLLRHVLDAAQSVSPDALHVVYGHGGDLVRAAFAAEPITWSAQSEQLGTGHAVMQALPQVPDDHLVLILYGDVPFVSAATLSRLVAAATEESMSLLTADTDTPDGYGRIIRSPSGAVIAIVEQKDATPAELAIREVNAGFMAIPARRLRRWLADLGSGNAQGEYYLTDVVAAAVRDRCAVIAVAADAAEIVGVNDKRELALAEAHYRRARATELMLAGVTLADPARIDVRGVLRVGRDVAIDVNCVFEGTVHLGDGVKIGPNCVIRDSTVGTSTEIHAMSLLDRARVGERCVVGPYARLRPASALGDEAHVGNFVELKNTRLGSGSKANHLTYLGDADIGAGVNVGAGTVTCNYDGTNKWSTVIGDGAFIGSGSMLVAPVEIGARATIGAGSTITADAPADKLTLARTTQTTIPAWSRPTKRTPR
jgi:bifunctional UDP-N-acetylglucosamine pyrophosphorylase/glucosamine-1-phosphate N-acetyltransferase